MDAFRTNWTFIKVETDEGLCGWVRPVWAPANTRSRAAWRT